MAIGRDRGRLSLARRLVYIDVHNHVIPDAVLRLAERDATLGISACGGVFRSPHHVPFPLLAAFRSPEEKMADLAARGLWGAVISPPRCCSATTWPRPQRSPCARPATREWPSSALTRRTACTGWPTCQCRRPSWRPGCMPARWRPARSGRRWEPRSPPPPGRAGLRGLLGAGRRHRQAGAHPPGLQLLPPGPGPVVPAERDRQPAGNHHHGGTAHLRRGPTRHRWVRLPATYGGGFLRLPDRPPGPCPRRAPRTGPGAPVNVLGTLRPGPTSTPITHDAAALALSGRAGRPGPCRAGQRPAPRHGAGDPGGDAGRRAPPRPRSRRWP